MAYTKKNNVMRSASSIADGPDNSKLADYEDLQMIGAKPPSRADRKRRTFSPQRSPFSNACSVEAAAG
jgi:hypothetical protein